MIYNPKMKYFVFIVFLCYFNLNLVFVVNNLKTNLPLNDLIPSQSYLHKHYQNHQKHFKIGPMIMLNFMQPVNYTNNETYQKINSFIEDVQRIKSVSKFSLSWLQVTKKNQQMQTENELCLNEIDCFFSGLKQTRNEDTYVDDVNLIEFNNSNKTINSSRIYLQFEKFTGSYDELETLEAIQSLAEEKYNYDKEFLIIFSAVNVFLEQLREIFPSVLSLFMLSIECLFLGSLFLVFDLQSIFIQMIIGISLVLSILSNIYVFNLSLNIVTLFQLIMLPAFLFEFLFYTLYLFLFKTNFLESKSNDSFNLINIPKLLTEKDTINLKEYHSNSTASSTSDNSIESDFNTLQIVTNDEQTNHIDQSNELIKNNNIKFLMKNCIDITFIYLFILSIISFSIMFNCVTYNFHSLFLILMITCVNILIHLCLFYPNLLILFGTCWKN